MRAAILLMVLGAVLLAGCAVEAPVPDADAADAGSADAMPAAPAAGEPEEEGRTLGTLRDVLDWGRSAHCTWNVRTEEGRMTGEMWVKGDKFKQVMDVEGQTINSISDGEHMYMWGDTMPGMKIPMDMHEAAEEPSDAGAVPSGPDMDVEYNYECNPTVVADSAFVPPRDVDFQDIGEMMAAMGR